MLAHDGVVVGEPDPQQLEHELFPLALPPGKGGEDPFELLEREEVGIVRDRCHGRRRSVRDALHDGREERLLRVEVVVEGALRRAKLVEDVLDAQLLVTPGRGQALRDIDERVAAESVDRRVHCAGRILSIIRPTVGLIIGSESRPCR